MAFQRGYFGPVGLFAFWLPWGGDGANDAVDTLVAASVLTVGDGGSLTVPYSLAVLIQDAGAASDVGVDDGLIMGAIADYLTSRLRVLAEQVVEGDSTA